MIVLDEELQGIGLEGVISRWYRGTVSIVTQLRPGTVIKDEATPQLLQRIVQPTFVTINHTDFWRRAAVHRSFCVVCLKLGTEHVDLVSPWLRRLFSLPELRTKQLRMGKVVLASNRGVRYYSSSERLIHFISWSGKD